MSQMIIILGAARSGTKYLRDILALAPNASKVPYDINYVWRYGADWHSDDAIPPTLLTDRKARFIRKQIYRMARADPKGGRIVFEKTVGNTLRVEYCNAVFPNAKFIHLVRDGRAVTESSMRQWQEPLDYSRLIEKLRSVPLQNFGYIAWFGFNVLRGLFSGRGGGRIWGPRYQGIESEVSGGSTLAEICARQWRASVESTLDALERIVPERHMTIRYNDLVSGDAALSDLARFCGLENVDVLLAAHRERVDARTDTKWRDSLSALELEQVLPIVEPTLQRLGYPVGAAK